MTHPAGRRAAAIDSSARRPWGRALAVVLPVVAVVGVAATSGAPAPTAAPEPPSSTTLTSEQLVCPGPIDGRSSLALTSLADSGELTLRMGEQSSQLPVTRDELADASPSGPMVVDGRDALAPGLVASRIATDPVTTAACLAPQPDYWFTGVGAGATHTSTLELVNPDAGPAIAEITLYGEHGPIVGEAVASVTVEGGSSQTLNLSDVVPNRQELTAHVAVGRGRLVASTVDTFDTGSVSTAWLPPQDAPAVSNYLTGFAKGATSRELVLTNPSDDEARVKLQVVGESSTFAPQGLEEIQVPPGATLVTDVTSVLKTALDVEASGLLVTSDVPVTAAVRSREGTRLSHVVPGVAVTDAAAAVPAGETTLALTATGRAGAVRLSAFSASGEQLLDRRFEVDLDRLTTLEVPRGAALVQLRADRELGVVGSTQTIGDGGPVVLPLRDVLSEGLVPAVRPAGVPAS